MTAMVHANVDIPFFMNEEELKWNAIPSDYYD
jgi:hypothetical protein